LVDGTRHLLDPLTGEVVETYKSGVRGYRKSSLEIDTLVIGDPKHREVVCRIYRLKLEKSNLKSLIVEEIQRQEDASRSEHGELERLECEQHKLKKKYALQMNQLGGSVAMDDLVQESLDQTKRQLQVIDDRLSQIAVGYRMTESEINELADGVIDDLRPLLDELSGPGDVGLRKIVEAFVGSAVVDLVEGKVDFEFVLPNEVLMQRYRSLGSSLEPASGGQTPKWKPITLSTRAILIPEKCRGSCWDPFISQGCRNCHRKPRAA